MRGYDDKMSVVKIEGMGGSGYYLVIDGSVMWTENGSASRFSHG